MNKPKAEFGKDVLARLQQLKTHSACLDNPTLQKIERSIEFLQSALDASSSSDFSFISVSEVSIDDEPTKTLRESVADDLRVIQSSNSHMLENVRSSLVALKLANTEFFDYSVNKKNEYTAIYKELELLQGSIALASCRTAATELSLLKREAEDLEFIQRLSRLQDRVHCASPKKPSRCVLF